MFNGLEPGFTLNGKGHKQDKEVILLNGLQAGPERIGGLKAQPLIPHW